MKYYSKKYVFVFFILFGAFLFLFNLYYFFIREDRGIIYYYEKFFGTPKDPTITSMIYQDMAEEYSILNKNIQNKFVVVFVGDSVTKRFNFQEYFPDILIINRGIFGDTTQGILNRLNQNIQNLNIDKLFLLAGYNDLLFRTDDEIVKNIHLIASRIKAKRICIQSLLPIDPKEKKLNHRIININRSLRLLCRDYGYDYVDLHSHFVGSNGGIYEIYSHDGVHPNAKGYQLWSKILKPMILNQ